uniref:Trimethylguanosine synthase n=1 Tax=Caenorhabditis tropicalis TaxID=1561998 RepID=A0A1I7UYB6_9PELO
MSSSTESVLDEQGDYQWPWCQMGHFGINFIQSDDSKAYVEGDLTRAYIKDYDLLKASKRPKPEETEELIQTDLSEMSLKEDETEALGEASDKLLDEKDRAFEVLPKWSSDKRKGKKKKGKGRYNYHSFKEYWDVSCFWLTQLTWLNDFGEQMTEDNRKELTKQCDEMKPIYPIDHHENLLENSDYQNVTKKMIETNPEATFEEIYAEHCSIIKKQSEIDYHIFQTKEVTRRCKDMISRVKRLGYAPGFEETQFPAFYNLEDHSKIREKPVIKEIRYTIDEAYAKKFCGADPRDEKTDESTASTSDINIQQESSSQNNITNDNPSEIRFNFNPETEQHLIASNAEKLYANDPEISKYYWQRYRLFSRLDEGIIMDREGWFSVTPEAIAEHIADRVVRHNVSVVVDAFTGVGGNAIQFALRGAHVIAIDMDPVRLKCARENARVYGVEDYIDFICADFFDVAATWTMDKKMAPKVDAVFLSPPWGGPSYLKAKEFDLETGCCPNGVDIFDVSLKISPNIAYFLPRNTKVSQLTELAIKAKSRMEIEQSSLNSKIKTITVYYGKLAYREKSQKEEN